MHALRFERALDGDDGVAALQHVVAIGDDRDARIGRERHAVEVAIDSDSARARGDQGHDQGRAREGDDHCAGSSVTTRDGSGKPSASSTSSSARLCSAGRSSTSGARNVPANVPSRAPTGSLSDFSNVNVAEPATTRSASPKPAASMLTDARRADAYGTKSPYVVDADRRSGERCKIAVMPFFVTV